MQMVAGKWKNESNCRTGCRIGEGDLNTKLLIAWIKGFNAGWDKKKMGRYV